MTKYYDCWIRTGSEYKEHEEAPDRVELAPVRMGLREENDALRQQLSGALTALAALCLKSEQPLQLSQIDLFRADGATISTKPDGKGGILIAAIRKEEER